MRMMTPEFEGGIATICPNTPQYRRLAAPTPRTCLSLKMWREMGREREGGG